MDGIYGFSGDYRWLSNFWPAAVMYDGVIYPSVEHAYQAAKTLDANARSELRSVTAGRAKALGKKLDVRPDWEAIKLQTMLSLLQQKFRTSPLREALLQTGQRHIEETNTWGDKFWGVCNGEGQNWLGRLIMQVRQEVVSKSVLSSAELEQPASTR